MKLKLKNIYLRPIEPKDADENYPKWLNDPEVCRYNSHGDAIYTKEMATEYIKTVSSSPVTKVFAICIEESDLHIGNISLQQISQKNQSAELAILMGEKNFWGKGYAKEAAKALIEYAFDELELHRIYCGTHIDNIAMQKLAISIGMTQEGVLKDAMYKNGRFYDIIEYGIIKGHL